MKKLSISTGPISKTDREGHLERERELFLQNGGSLFLRGVNSKNPGEEVGSGRDSSAGDGTLNDLLVGGPVRCEGERHPRDRPCHRAVLLVEGTTQERISVRILFDSKSKAEQTVGVIRC